VELWAYRLYDRWLRPGRPGSDPLFRVKRWLHRVLSAIGGRRFKQTLVDRPVLYDNHHIRIDPQDSLRVLSGRPIDPAEMALLASHLGTDGVAVDIGANIGLYTLAMARRVGPHGRVFAFEPAPANFALLTRNVESNGYSAIVTACRTAITDRSGLARFTLNVHNAGMHRLASEGAIEVETARLDDLLAGQRVDFVKIDVEGAEVAVLRGMQSIIAANPSIALLVEYNESGLRTFHHSTNDLFAELEGFTFTVAGKMGAASRAELAAATRGDGAYANLLFKRRHP